MPYTIVRRGGDKPWKIVRKEDDQVVGSSDTRRKAERSVKKRMEAERK